MPAPPRPFAAQRPTPAVPKPFRPAKPALQPFQVVTAAQQNAGNYNAGVDLRVSNDGKMAVRDTGNQTPTGSAQYQQLWLEQSVLTTSRAALKAAQSGVKLRATGNTIRGKPAGNLFKHTLQEVSISFRDTVNNQSYQGCNANAGHVMGTIRNAQPTARIGHTYVKKNINGSRLISQQQDEGAGYKAIRGQITGATTASAAKNAWVNLSDAERKKAAKKYGFNQYARPKAAEAIGVFNVGPHGGMGHFGGVLARSGKDYVVLENFAGNTGGSTHSGVMMSPNWYVRMFGARTGQSWWDHHKTNEAADYGNAPMAVRIKGI